MEYTHYYHFNSKDRDSGTIENPTFTIQNPFTLQAYGDRALGKKFQLTVISANIPFSFYSVNEYNNKVNVYRYYQDGSLVFIKELVFETGNYNIYEFNKLFFNTINDDPDIDISTLNITYSRTKNKNEFSMQLFVSPWAGIALEFTDGSPYEIFGFDVGEFLILNDSSQRRRKTVNSIVEEYAYQISPNCVNVLSINKIYLRAYGLLQEFTESSRNKTGSSNILAKIELHQASNSTIDYDPNNPLRVIVNADTLDMVSLKLTDDRERLLNLNGLHWSCTLAVDVI